MRNSARNSDLRRSGDLEGRTLAEAVFRQLREDLLAAKFGPGERLRLKELKRLYGVGFSPLREALMRLAADGLVVAEGQRGFCGAPISTEDLQDVTRTRQQIEALVLADSLEHGDDDWEARIVAAFHRLTKVPAIDPETGAINDEWARRHFEFHYSLIAGARSRWMKHFWKLTYDQSDRYRRLAVTFGSDLRDNPGEHRQLMEAVLSRNVHLACELSHQHIERTAQIVMVRIPMIQHGAAGA